MYTPPVGPPPKYSEVDNLPYNPSSQRGYEEFKRELSQSPSPVRGSRPPADSEYITSYVSGAFALLSAVFGVFSRSRALLLGSCVLGAVSWYNYPASTPVPSRRRRDDDRGSLEFPSVGGAPKRQSRLSEFRASQSQFQANPQRPGDTHVYVQQQPSSFSIWDVVSSVVGALLTPSSRSAPYVDYNHPGTTGTSSSTSSTSYYASSSSSRDISPSKRIVVNTTYGVVSNQFGPGSAREMSPKGQEVASTTSKLNMSSTSERSDQQMPD